MLVLFPSICHISATYLSWVSESSWPLPLRYLLAFKPLLCLTLLLSVTLAVRFWIFHLSYLSCLNKLTSLILLCCFHWVLNSRPNNLILFMHVNYKIVKCNNGSKEIRELKYYLLWIFHLFSELHLLYLKEFSCLVVSFSFWGILRYIYSFFYFFLSESLTKYPFNKMWSNSHGYNFKEFQFSQSPKYS